MNPFVVFAMALLPAIKALCYSPLMHGLAPDVILPHMFSSEVFCPTPHVFDYFNCICVDRSMIGHASMELSLMRGSDASRQDGLPAYSLSRFSGLPDTHDARHLWVPVTVAGRRLVPELNPYGSYNLPANSNVLKAAVKLLSETATASKQLELLEKVRWQQQLEREAAVVAAAAVAAAGGVPGTPTVVGNTASLDGFMRDTLRRILYG